MKLLHIDSSIQSANSITRPVTAAVVKRLNQITPGLDVTYRDLAASPVDHLGLSHLPKDHPLAITDSLENEASVTNSRAISVTWLEEFVAADIVVIGAPMVNFTVPSQLKAWIDRILIPGKTFRFTETGPQGLIDKKRVIIVVSRGGFYGADSPIAAAEHTERYLRTVFGFIGLTNPEIILADGVQSSPEQRRAAVESALHAAANLALA